MNQEPRIGVKMEGGDQCSARSGKLVTNLTGSDVVFNPNWLNTPSDNVSIEQCAFKVQTIIAHQWGAGDSNEWQRK